MKKKEILLGGQYRAKVGGKLTTVRVDNIREVWRSGKQDRTTTVYDVTNLTTGRRMTFRSAVRFRGPAAAVTPKPVVATVPV